MFGGEKINRPENPITKSWCLTKIFFLWTIDIYRLGMQRQLQEKDVYSPLPEHSSEIVTDIFTKLWNEELKRRKPRLIRAILRGFGFRLISFSTIFSLTEASLRILLPICLGGLLSYFVPGQTEITRYHAFMFALSISGVTVLIAILFHPFIFYVIQCGIKLQVGCYALLYQKVLKFSKSTNFDGMNGQVINLMSNDVTKIELGLCFHNDLWKGPIEALIMGYLIYKEIGFSGIIGMIFLLSFIPIQVWVGKKSATCHLKASKRTDSRIKFMNEIIQAIQVIKMYAWEKSFATIVDTIRRKEMNSIRGSAYGRAALFSFQVISRIAIFLSFSSYVYFGEAITARKVFIVTSYFMSLSSSMVFYWPMAITEVLNALISLNRIEIFLLQPEGKQSSIENEIKASKWNLSNKEMRNDTSEVTLLLPRNRTHNEKGKAVGININNLTAAWNVEEGHTGVFSIDLDIQPKKLCTIVGPVGSGKTTLLNVIIGELEHDSGSITIEGNLSYSSQEAWLFAGTIRQNIVFTENYDTYRYHDVCRVCALEQDFELLPFGDKTMVEERGVNLSGGQRARINLARSVYRKADIYLLDDPLSAVDVKVGKQIYNQCIQGYLKEKCVVLVTHQIQYLKKSEHIVVLNNGRIEAQGNFDFIKSKNQKLIMEMISPQDDEKAEKPCKFESEINASNNSLNRQEDESKEMLAKGTLSIGTYKLFFNSVENKLTIALNLILFTLSILLVTSVDYFIAKWCNWEELIASRRNDNITANIENLTTNKSGIHPPSHNTLPFLFSTATDESSIRQQYILTYLILILMMMYLVVHRNFAFFKMCIRISINLHDRLFRGVSRATMHFFNTNPSGWILNRFSKDIGMIDSILPQTLLDTILCYLEMVSMGLIVCFINPWLLIPTAIIGAVLYGFRRVYLATSRSLNRLQAISRSPIYAHTNTTIQGLTTIKSFKAENALTEKFNEYVNNNTASFFLFRATARTFGQWVDIISAVYVIFITFSCLLTFSGDKLGGDVGLIISKGLLFLGMLQWGLRQSAELENRMISVERVEEYTKLTPEATLETLQFNIPGQDWPSLGVIHFNNVSLRYSSEKPYILKGLNLTINSKEKIGIVGRTGAGKSSIIHALFRLTEPEGKIEIDGVEIQTLGLHDLRKQISIIPQDPVLFSGTMRNNLDPFHEKLDEDLWNALEEVRLKETVTKLAGGLDSKMSDCGSNFSMGQRQLICLARAILRFNKILILDEATANVDPDTDKLIQATIRTKFVDCTVLTIAHRLHTVLDNDRILVMDNGRAVEFDSPHVLLQNPNSHVKRLFDEAGIDLYQYF